MRYDPDQEFKAHMDGTYVRESGPKMGERSHIFWNIENQLKIHDEFIGITVKIYLNEGFKGGETTFYSENND